MDGMRSSDVPGSASRNVNVNVPKVRDVVYNYVKSAIFKTQSINVIANNLFSM